MHRFRIALAALSLTLVTGCATETKFRRMLDGWVGKRDSDLVVRMGPPEKSFVAADGSKVLQWTAEHDLVMHCTMNFVISPAGKVASYSFDGNSCRSW